MTKSMLPGERRVFLAVGPGGVPERKRRGERTLRRGSRQVLREEVNKSNRIRKGLVEKIL